VAVWKNAKRGADAFYERHVKAGAPLAVKPFAPSHPEQSLTANPGPGDKAESFRKHGFSIQRGNGVLLAPSAALSM
jgi:hypothetical protein